MLSNSHFDRTDKSGLHMISPHQILSILHKNEHCRERILKQLEQIDIDVSKLQHLSLNDLMLQVEDIMKRTYSIKYLGLNRQEMGIISRRVDPNVEGEFKIDQIQQTSYTINKYFYPKPLKVGKKATVESRININNLQNEIKKEFEENINKKKQIQRSPSLSTVKKPINGSWLSIAKLKNQIQNNKKNNLQTLKPKTNISSVLQDKSEPIRSFSRFLNKGILIIRD